MKLREFLNTTSVDWKKVKIWTDESYYSSGHDEVDSFTDMRDMSDELLDLYVDAWDVEVYIDKDNTVKYILEVLI